MKILIEPAAAAFIDRRGGHLTVFASAIHGCCGLGGGCVPMFELDPPRKHQEQYTTEEIAGISVHLHRTMAAEEKDLRIHLTGRFWKTLSLA